MDPFFQIIYTFLLNLNVQVIDKSSDDLDQIGYTSTLISIRCPYEECVSPELHVYNLMHNEACDPTLLKYRLV